MQLLGYGEGAPRWRTDVEVELRTHRDAVAMPLRTPPRGSNRMLAAVYDRHHRIVLDSERAKVNHAWASNPSRLPAGATAPTRRLEGRTFFGGYFRPAFGHVLLEMLPRFWPDLDYGAFDHVLLYPTRLGDAGQQLRLDAYAVDLLAALGVDAGRCVLVDGEGLVCDELTVSTPPFVLKSATGPALTEPFDRALRRLVPEPARAAGPGTRVYLSRSRLPDSTRKAVNEAAVEQLFVDAGFVVVHPQELAIADQVALVGAADAVAGCDGSALHLALFARPGTTVVAVDSRESVNQLMIDDARGLESVHVLANHEPHQERDTTWIADLDLVRAAIAAAGLS